MRSEETSDESRVELLLGVEATADEWLELDGLMAVDKVEAGLRAVDQSDEDCSITLVGK